MKERVRSPKRSPIAAPPSPSRMEERLHRFLRPGALARLRDTRISSSSRSLRSAALLLTAAARSHRLTPPSSPAPLAAAADGSPFFAGCRIRGPRCPQRKKLCAARAVFLVPAGPAGPEGPPDAPPSLDRLGSDLLLAH